MKATYAKRIKLTKNGKLMHRQMAVDHFKSKNSGQANQNKRKEKALQYPILKIIRLARSKYKLAK